MKSSNSYTIRTTQTPAQLVYMLQTKDRTAKNRRPRPYTHTHMKHHKAGNDTD